MHTLEELNKHYEIPNVLTFEEGRGGLLRARITSETCEAALYLHGAHLVHWQPAGHKPVLFMSEQSLFSADKAIRGGVPVVFPWFGPRTGERTDGPMHGFARIQVWNVAFAAVSDGQVHLTLTLEPTETSRALGYDNFRVLYELILGSELTMRLSVINLGESAMPVEEAFHTYFLVGDARGVKIEGLGGAEYLDKTDSFKRKTQAEEVLTLHGTTDRPYLNTEAAVTLEDPAMNRRIVVAKTGSKTTVVWNPWAEVAKTLADFGDDEWPTMTCIETANASENALTLAPREAHTMETKITVETL